MKKIVSCLQLPFLLFSFCYVFIGCKKEIITNDIGESFNYSAKVIAPGVTIGDIYTTGNFASFTDIAYYNNSWYVIFRTGTKHIGGVNGKIKILKSTDAITWTVDHIFENDSLDLRDPKFIVDTLNNELYINFMGAINQPGGSNYRLHNFMSFYSRNYSYNEYNGIKY